MKELREYIDTNHKGNVSDFARSVNLTRQTIWEKLHKDVNYYVVFVDGKTAVFKGGAKS